MFNIAGETQQSILNHVIKYESKCICSVGKIATRISRLFSQSASYLSVLQSQTCCFITSHNKTYII